MARSRAIAHQSWWPEARWVDARKKAPAPRKGKYRRGWAGWEMWGAEDSLKAVPRKCLKLTLLAFAFSWGGGRTNKLDAVAKPRCNYPEDGGRIQKALPCGAFLIPYLGRLRTLSLLLGVCDQ